jgi:hypothetical protein
MTAYVSLSPIGDFLEDDGFTQFCDETKAMEARWVLHMRQYCTMLLSTQQKKNGQWWLSFV